MSDEELRKMMEFIVEHQAQFAANIQMHEERLAKHDDNLARLEENQARIQDNIDRVTGLVGAIAVAQADTEMKQAQTEQRLNAFIVTVERYISQGRNGKT
jgi:hypothetical protein